MSKGERESRKLIETEVSRYASVGVALGWEMTHRNGCAVLQLGNAVDRVYFPRATHCNLSNLAGKVRRALRAIGATQCDPFHVVAQTSGLDAARNLFPLGDPKTRHEKLFTATSKEIDMKNGAAVIVKSNGHTQSAGPLPKIENVAKDTQPPVVQQKSTVGYAPPAPPAPVEEKPKRGTQQKKLTHDEVVKTTMLLGRNGDPVADGIYAYDAGWSDERVRDLVWPECPIEKIAELRRKHFGLTKEEAERAAARSRSVDNSAHVSALEDRVIAVEAANASLREEVAQLRAWLQRVDGIVAPLVA